MVLVLHVTSLVVSLKDHLWSTCQLTQEAMAKTIFLLFQNGLTKIKVSNKPDLCIPQSNVSF